MIHKRVVLNCLLAGMISVAVLGNVFAEEERKDTDGFEKSLALGLTITEGNTETTLFTMRFNGDYIGGDNEFHLKLGGAYGETDNETSAENAKASVTYRRLLSERMYAALDVSGLYDAQADIDYRIISSPGVGYYWVKSETVRLLTDFGPAYVFEKVGGEEDDYFALRLSERLEWRLSDTAKVWQSLEYVPRADHMDIYLLNAEVGIEAALNSRLNLQVTANNAYNSDPADDAKKNDLSVVTALVVSL